MNSANWTFVGNQRKTSRVNLKHGVESGNLIIFLEGKVLLIDYDVFEKADYTFFIDEEFCKISITKKKNKFQYQFDVLDDVDTPLNKRRKEFKEKKYNHTLKMALLALGIILFLVGGGVGIKHYRTLQKRGITTATIVVKDHQYKGESYNAAYTFQHKKQDFIRHIDLPVLSDGTILTENGFPALVGDQFLVEYYFQDPLKNNLLFSRPTKDQIDQYEGRLLNKLKHVSPDLSTDYCNCIMKAYYNISGLNGYLELYFRNVSPTENPTYNNETYQVLANHPKIAAAENDCHLEFIKDCYMTTDSISTLH